MSKVVVGTRGSGLALIQAEHVIKLLKNIDPGLDIIPEIIKTSGDETGSAEIPKEYYSPKLEGKGFFVREIEQALLEGKIDLAVHSMKDLPTTLPPGLKIGAILEREDPRDVLITRDKKTLEQLQRGSTVATSSLRRMAQLKALRPDLKFVPVRGNVDTRLRKLYAGNFTALVLAYAGVKRMGWLEHIAEIFPSSTCLPAAGQGALGVEIRQGDVRMEKLVSPLEHKPTSISVEAERAFLRKVEGGCQVPVGVLGETLEDRVFLQGVICSLDGRTLLRAERNTFIVSNFFNPEELGSELGRELISRGGADILKQVRQEFELDER